MFTRDGGVRKYVVDRKGLVKKTLSAGDESSSPCQLENAVLDLTGILENVGTA